MLGWLSGRGYCDLGQNLAETRAQRDALMDKVRDQMARADRAELDLSQARHDLTVARDDVQTLNQKLADVEKRAGKASELLQAEQDAHRATRERLQAESARLREVVAEHADAANYYGGLAEDRRVENVALKAELESLRTLIGNARNQLDGRAHHSVTSIEIAECVGA